MFVEQQLASPGSAKNGILLICGASIGTSFYIVSVLGRDKRYTVNYTKEFPRAQPKGTPEDKGVYLTVYPESSTNTDSISF